MRTAFAVLFKLCGGLTFCGVALYGLVFFEVLAPFSNKPSIILQYIAGDLPSRHIDKELEALQLAHSQIDSDIQTANEALAQQQAAQTELGEHYNALLARVDEQNLTVWSVPYQP